MENSDSFARPRVVAIIQARMGSTRLPGKVLKPIAGRPLLWHVVERLKRSHCIHDIAIATSTHPRDDAISEFGLAHGIAVVRGPEDDVLARFALAADSLAADVVVRVSSDSLFIDAGFIDHLVTALLEQDGDYVLLEDGAITAHEGVDPFSRRALDRLMNEAHDDPVAREHVSGYFKLHPDFVRIVRALPYPALAREAGRLTIDTPDDLVFAEAVHARLAAHAGEASLSDLLLLLEREPQLRGLNGHVRQKTMAMRGALALIRCDGGGDLGYGHVKRMIVLARALRDQQGIGVIFALNGTEDARDTICHAGFEASLLDPAQSAIALARVIAARRPDFLICDLRENLTREQLVELGKGAAVTAVVDDGSDRRLAADLAYYPPLAQVKTLDWSGSHCVPRIGWEWSLLGTQVTTTLHSPRALPSLLVTMGGSDPMGLTLRAAEALATFDQTFHARFVIGPGVRNRSEVAEAITGLSRDFEIVEPGDSLAALYETSDLALAAFGVTAYELAAYGVPALYLCLTEDHAISASAFEQAGIGVSLGVADIATRGFIAQSVGTLIADPARRNAMRRCALATIDGRGAQRIAEDLAQALSDKRASRATGTTG
ncbi:MAG TPA: NTP transferase domain-containing protein [Rhizomicrobium sp.]|jgi:spore coat polysaccharide biosynthesis protein SpsF